MGDSYPTIRAAAVQAASVFLDREASTLKACELIRRAGRDGARIVAFPEGFIPAHPLWFHFHAATGPISKTLSLELFKNAIEVPSAEVDELRRAAADAGVYAVVGICEKLPNTLGTMFNTQLFIGPDGTLVAKRQKLTPTVGERLVHAPGQGSMVRAIDTDFGPASALICGENANPLAIFALAAQHTRVHVMSWPSHFETIGVRERAIGDAKAFAQMAKSYVISACGAIDERMAEVLRVPADLAPMLHDPRFSGGSVIVSPMSEVIAGPMGTEEGILYADLDLEVAIKTKLARDYAGHYNRPDVFQLLVREPAEAILDIRTERAEAVPES